MNLFRFACGFVIFGCLVIVGALFSRLDPHAQGMAIGMVFGAMATVPTALLVLASNRRRPADDEDDVGGYTQPVVQNPPPPLLAERTTVTERLYGQPGTGIVRREEPSARVVPQLPTLSRPDTTNGRKWKVVGEKDGWLDEW